MRKIIYSTAFIILILVIFCNSHDSEARGKVTKNAVTSATFDLSAFGVESDNFPNIYAFIDFEKDSSYCDRSYYDPSVKGAGVYRLTKKEIHDVRELLENADLDTMKKNFTIDRTDQPSATSTINCGNLKYVFTDYGLVGESPLKEIYKIVFKF